MEKRGEDRQARSDRRPDRNGGDRGADARNAFHAQGRGSFAGRSGHRDRDERPFRPREDFRGRETAAVQDLDEELLRLIMRRARLLAKLRAGGRLDAGREKALRTSWEEKAARLTRDSRLARDLFALLQSVEPLSRSEEEQAFFNLAPLRRPADFVMPAPADAVAARCWLALAAASGQKTELRDVPLADGVTEGVKALNQLGGQLWWEEDGTVLSRGGKGLIRGMDKVVHVGDDAFNLWLVLALCLGMPSRLKVTGGNALRLLNLAPLRHFLPEMGARLTNVIPAHDGLPIRVECSGMPPAGVSLPDNLPVDFCAALLLAAPFRDQTASLTLPSAALPRAGRIVDMLRQAGVNARLEGRVATVVPGPLTLPAVPALPMDVPLAASLLALPVLTGGSVRLRGHWPETGEAAAAEKLLRAMGTDVTVEADSVSSCRKIPEGHAEDSALPLNWTAEAAENAWRASAGLRPLVASLGAAAALGGFSVSLPGFSENAADDEGDEHILAGFLACLDLTQTAGGAIVPDAPAGEAEDGSDRARAPWISPSALWAVALALAAFARPNLRLANPGVLTERFPGFWALYNGLPRPDFNRRKKPEDNDGRPVRRRIIAQGVYGELPPEPASGDEGRA